MDKCTCFKFLQIRFCTFFQDYESLIVLNTVPKLSGTLNLAILDDLPTLGTVSPGQVLTKDQVCIF
jgi:hypothetical protein